MVLPTECGGEPLAQDGQPEGAVRLTPRGAARERGPACRAGGPACAGLAPLAILAPPQRAPQHCAARCACLSVPPARDAPWRGA